MGARTVDDKSSDTLVVVSGEGFWTGSSTLPHLHQIRLPGALLSGVDEAVARLVRGAAEARQAIASARTAAGE